MTERDLFKAYGLELEDVPHTAEVEPNTSLPRGVGVVGQREPAPEFARRVDGRVQRVSALLPTIRRAE